MSTTLAYRAVLHFSTADNRQTYSTNLQAIPIITLNETKRIDIRQVIAE
ncbi:MAG: hypothetical protein AAGI23_14240 [Bacteroidota bacterium]